MSELLAQAPTLPDVHWWQQYGPLGIVALIVAAAVVTYLWVLHFPNTRATQQQDLRHRQRKQDLETEREEKLNTFIDLLSESHSAEVEFKRQIATTLDRMDKRQSEHSDACERSERKIDAIDQHLRTRTA